MYQPRIYVYHVVQQQGRGLRMHLALAAKPENPEQYDTIPLGYLNWWGDMPQPLFIFLEEYDFSGKTIGCNRLGKKS